MKEAGLGAISEEQFDEASRANHGPSDTGRMARLSPDPGQDGGGAGSLSRPVSLSTTLPFSGLAISCTSRLPPWLDNLDKRAEDGGVGGFVVRPASLLLLVTHCEQLRKLIA